MCIVNGLILKVMAMIKTFKHIRIKLMMMVVMFLSFTSVQAQAILFSSDQWPKRWGRAMNHQTLSGHIMPAKRKPADIKKVSQQSWGQQQNDKRRKRSRTPDYNGGTYERYEADPLKRRYAVPRPFYGTSPYSSGYGLNPMNGYYGNYPAMGYPGTYPGLYQGLGVPGLGVGIPGLGVPGLGFPYSSPFLLAPGMTPGLAAPW